MRLRKLAAIATFGTAAFGLVGVLGVAGCGNGAERTSSDGAGGQAAAPQAPSQPGSVGSDAKTGQQPVSAQERRVVRTAQMTLWVDDVTTVAAGTRQVAERFGGFVSNERTEQDSASITLRVEVNRLDDALSALDELGDVTHREQQAEDVTEQVVDVQARIANQRASVERVRALLDRATTIGEVVQIESELTTRQAALESLENRAGALASQTELATVTVTLTHPPAPALADDGGGFFDGFGTGWRAFVAAIMVLLTVLGALLPFLLVLGLPALIALLIVRHRRAAAQPQPPAPETGA